MKVHEKNYVYKHVRCGFAIGIERSTSLLFTAYVIIRGKINVRKIPKSEKKFNITDTISTQYTYVKIETNAI